MYLCLAKLSPLDPATGERVDVFLSSFDARKWSQELGLNNTIWCPAIKAPPQLQIALWNGDFTAAVEPGIARLPIDLNAGQRRYDDIASYLWQGAAVEIYAEKPGTPWPWAKRFVGNVSGYGGTYPELVLTAQVATAPFDRDILSAAYAGTSGLEGGSDLKGRPKPLVLGWARNVEPVLIDATNSIYQFSGYGPIEAVSALYERGSNFGAVAADYADYAALVAATIPEGKWATCLAAGLVRLGAPSAGVITGDVRGHLVGSATPRRTGAVISALAAIAGVAPDQLDGTTLAALDTAVARPINLVVAQQESFFDRARALALACNWQAGVSLTGSFFVSSVSVGGAAAITLHAQGRALPQITAVEEQDVSPPYFKTTLGAARSWRVHSADEIAYGAEIVYTGRYDDDRFYVEGNVVNLIDGSEWIYIAAEPSKGNEPPLWPVTSNTWWENMTPPREDLIVSAELTIRTARVHSPRTTSNAIRYMLQATTSGNTSTISVARHDWDYPNGNADITRELGTLGGCQPNTEYWVYFDDPTLASNNPSYDASTNAATAENKSTTPYRHPLGRIKTPPVGSSAIAVGGAAPGFGYQTVGYEAGAVIDNFNARNDRVPTIPGAIFFPALVTTVEHANNPNGSIDLSVDWGNPGGMADNDGIEIGLYGSTSSAAYTPGSNPAAESIYQLPPNIQSFYLRGLQPTLWYTWFARAFRDVDPDVADAVRATNPSSVVRNRIVGPWAKPQLSTQNPYRPSANTAFAGDITGTVAGVAAGTVAYGALAANNGLNSDGTIKADKVFTDAIVNEALVAAGYAQQGAQIFVNGGSFESLFGPTLNTQGPRIVLDFHFVWRLQVTNPTQGQEWSVDVRGMLNNQNTLANVLSDFSTESVMWNRPSTSGNWYTERRRTTMQWVFDGTPLGPYKGGARFTVAAGVSLVLERYRYSKMNDLRALE